MGLTKLLERKTIINVTIFYFVTLVILTVYKYCLYDFRIDNILGSGSEIIRVTNLEDHDLVVKQYFDRRKNLKTSNLGTLLFKNENYTFKKRDKSFNIFVWKYWKWFQARYVRNSPLIRDVKDVLRDCSVDNCVFTGDNNSLHTADAVLIQIMYGMLPKVKNRNPEQLWVFLNDESPRAAFSRTNNNTQPKLKLWSNVFNWSMTYRTNADVPVPYGRTVPFRKPLKYTVTHEAIAELIPNYQFKRTDVLVTTRLTNCGVPFRVKFLEELEKYIKIDVYGKCSKVYKQECPRSLKSDCVLLDKYYFYLVIENSVCRQYLSENIYFNAYTKGAIPIVVGSSLQDCITLLPPNSYIYYEDYHTYKELAAKIIRVIQNVDDYVSYHMWRNHFKVTNEHGFFGTKSYHLCRLCEALNYNEEKKKSINFRNLRLFLDPSLLCTTNQNGTEMEFRW